MSVCVQMCLQWAYCNSAGAPSCLSPEFTWQQLMPDFAALARSLCLGVEALLRAVPRPALNIDSGVLHHRVPLDLQRMVRPRFLLALRHALNSTKGFVRDCLRKCTIAPHFDEAGKAPLC